MKGNLELQERQQWWRRRGRKSNMEGEKRVAGIFWRKREKICLFIKKSFSFLFHFLFKSNSTCHFLIRAKGPTFTFDLTTYSAIKEEKKTGPFWKLKSCLGLRAASLVLVPRVSLHPSGPVFESRQYIYQNAQNETLSEVQRLILLNFKLHAKR